MRDSSQSYVKCIDSAGNSGLSGKASLKSVYLTIKMQYLVMLFYIIVFRSQKGPHCNSKAEGLRGSN